MKIEKEAMVHQVGIEVNEDQKRKQVSEVHYGESLGEKTKRDQKNQKCG